MKEHVDTQFIAENVGFLDDCFDNSFVLQSSLVAVQEYVAQVDNTVFKEPSAPRKKARASMHNLSSTLNTTSKKLQLTQCSEKDTVLQKKLKNWGLPSEITNKYEEKGITEMFEWQVNCLANPKVMLDCCNLVYSAPTSAGKTLVAEIITIKTVLERQKKVIVILPFVSIVREKMFYLQDILSSSGVRVEGFVGSQTPPGGLQAVHIAICTIEKANSLINRMLDDGNIAELGAVIVDELHLLGDPHRGYILELLLTKIKYVTANQEDTQIQIVGMSATLPNLEVLANWLEAELYVTDFRPIPLNEYCLVGNNYFSKEGKCVRVAAQFKINYKDSIENDNVLKICVSTIQEGCSILIFCMTKNRCESLAQSIASSFFRLGSSEHEVGLVLRQQLKTESILEVLEQLKNCPVGLDKVLKNTISFGVAYHHAGLTFDERDIIEGAFKSGALRVLIATSTLSSGVNLPARRVIIRTPVFQRQPINILTYKQMIGRAGRMGKDTKGESVLICTEGEKKMGFDLMMGALDPVHSCIESEDKYMRAILEMIASQDVCTKVHLETYSKCTLLYAQQKETNVNSDLVMKTVDSLIKFELVRRQDDEKEIQYVATHLGKACLSSSMAPNDGISLFCELQKARQCLVLETDLHLIYLVTPYSVSSQWSDIDWLHLLILWGSLTKAMKKVGELVGVEESFIIRSVRRKPNTIEAANKLNNHKRFYTALALQDLVNEVPLAEVAHKFKCARGFLQSLQQASATFAGMVTAFCRQLGWKNMEMLISQFQDRLHFGIHSELLELLKLPSLNGHRARALYDLGFETVFSIASADVFAIENALQKAIPFQSEKERDDDDADDIRKRNKIKNIWITGFCGITTKEAAYNLIMEARKCLEYELGATEIKWNSIVNENNDSDANIVKIKEENVQVLKDDEKTQINYDNDIDKNVSIEVALPNSETRVVSLNIANVTNDLCSKNVIKSENNIIDDKQFQNTSKSNTNIEIVPVDVFLGINDYAKTNHTIISEPLEVKNEVNEWESLNFTEAIIENITKSRVSDNIFSPDVSIHDEDEFAANVNSHLSKNSSAKDVSLFSSEADSMFEESFPVDQISSKLLDDKDNKTVNTAQTSEIIQISDSSDEEDMKLIYDDDNKHSENELETGFNISDDIDEICTQNDNTTPLKSSFVSPFKRSSSFDQKSFASPAKKVKVSLMQTDLSKFNSKTCKIVVKNSELHYCVLGNKNLLEHLPDLSGIKKASIFIHCNNTPGVFEKIQRSIFGPTTTNAYDATKMYFGKVKYIAIFTSDCTCLVLDVESNYDNQLVKDSLSRWITNNSVNLKVMSLKTNLIVLKRWLDIELNCEDIYITEWLLDSDDRMPNISYLMKIYCDIELSSVPIIVDNKVRKFNKLNNIEIACIKAWSIGMVAEKLKLKLANQGGIISHNLEVETHVLRILALIEYYGLTVDKELASKLLTDVKNSQEILQKKAYKICGYHFSFNSSQAVAKVLGIYKGKRVSTKKSVLTCHNSPISSIIIYWRKLNTILTKTLYPLAEKAHHYSEGDRINPSYTMYTCTGRISMHEPNLQNVPRTFSIPYSYLSPDDTDPSDDVIEFNCRNIFKASAGCVLVSADYCQLEMRILTHYSGDPVLSRIMTTNEDVFKSIAASWSGVPQDQVDDDLRQKAKQLCYGILYGMGTKTLSQQLDVTEGAAISFIESFYHTFPQVRVFTQGVVKECRERGYVETLMMRRRYLPDINSNLPSKKGAAERKAVNTTIQGSAADIAKAAMCAIDNKTAGNPNKPRLILQMHDELIYDVPEENKKDFIKILKRAMENTVQLKVPLPVKVKSGLTWGTMEEIKI